MANDPHRAIQLPSLRYWVHLVAPGWNVIGAGEPALPGVSVGHNEQRGVGLHHLPDRPGRPLRLRDRPRGPLPLSLPRRRGRRCGSVRETIPVKGQAAVAAELKFTRHGPVVHEDREHHRAYALRAAWLEEGTAPYLASLRIDQAGKLGRVPARRAATS